MIATCQFKMLKGKLPIKKMLQKVSKFLKCDQVTSQSSVMPASQKTIGLIKAFGSLLAENCSFLSVRAVPDPKSIKLQLPILYREYVPSEAIGQIVR